MTEALCPLSSLLKICEYFDTYYTRYRYHTLLSINRLLKDVLSMEIYNTKWHSAPAETSPPTFDYSQPTLQFPGSSTLPSFPSMIDLYTST